MIYFKRIFAVYCFLFFALTIHAQKKEIYKTVDTTQLALTIYQPASQGAKQKYPALVFFFGGGWVSGDISQFQPHAEYLSKKGIVCFLVDYRVTKRNKTTPFESLIDAKSAIRYIKKNAEKFSIDTSRIAAAGGSAGGHLAAACFFAEKYNDKDDDLSVSSKPNALILFNPVIDNGPGGYGYERLGDEYRFFSPLHNLKKGAPPTIILCGTNDKLIPVETLQYYKKVMEKVGSRCDLILYEGAGHGFFNLKRSKPYHDQTLAESEKFLRSIGYISK